MRKGWTEIGDTQIGSVCSIHAESMRQGITLECTELMDIQCPLSEMYFRDPPIRCGQSNGKSETNPGVLLAPASTASKKKHSGACNLTNKQPTCILGRLRRDVMQT